MSHVYLLHFDPLYKHAGHYAGVTSRDDVAERIEEHRKGVGAVLCRHAAKAGVQLVLARVWRDVPRAFEMQIKGRSLRPLCPLCSGPAALTRRAT